jgi:hypothetical protein
MLVREGNGHYQVQPLRGQAESITLLRENGYQTWKAGRNGDNL